MNEKPDPNEYVHWQDLAEQLGADTASEFEHYFAGSAKFSGDAPDETDLPDTLPTEPTNRDLPPPAARQTPQADTVTTETSAAVAMQSAVAADVDNELGIDWSQPTPAPKQKQKASADEGSRKAKAKRKAKTQPPKETPSMTEDSQADREPQAADDELAHWGDLASTLGLSLIHI